MNLILFSTKRKIREFIKNFDNTFIDKTKTIGEFLNNIIVIKNKKLIDSDLRKIYLYKAVKDLNIKKLGFRKDFLGFVKDSEFIFSFLNELFLEKVDIDDVISSDIYTEFEEHLHIIKEIKNKYEELLQKDNYIDKFLIKDYEINKGLLKDINKIVINLDGYLSKSDMEILKKIDRPIEINLTVTPFNKKLIEKFLIPLEIGKYKIDFNNLKILKKEKINKNIDVKTYAFSNKFNEINFIFAKITEMVENGINPDKIGVILPDESLAEKLKELDEFKNLNFAMGISFTTSNLFIKLKAIYEYKINEDLTAYQKIKDIIDEYEKKPLLEFIVNLANEKEKKLIEEEIYKLKIFEKHITDKDKFLHLILNRFKHLSFDDVNGGKITVQGVLESRGIQYEGVIIVDFNEGLVPNINSKDLFLNTFVRKTAHLPTREDKENLQKHYYYSLFLSAKKVALAYVNNEENLPSRFLYQLNLKEAQNYDKVYEEIIFKNSYKYKKPKYNETFNIIEPITPSALKMLIECPKKYYFAKILKIQDTQQKEIFGSTLHNILEEAAHNRHLLSNHTELFEFITNRLYKEKSKKEIFDVKVKFEDAIKEFCEKDFDNIKYSKEIQPEQWINFNFENFRLSARADRIDINDNKITIIDYKTSSKVDQYAFDFQMTFYYLWAKQNYPDKEINIVFYQLNEHFNKINAKLKTEELKEILKKLPNKVKEAEDIIIDEKIIAKKNDICKYCIYKSACE